MSTVKWTLAGWFLCGAVLLCASPALSREKHGTKPQPKLNIRLEGKTGRIIVSWDGLGVLKQAGSRDGQFRPVRHGAGRYILKPIGTQAVFRLENGPAKAASDVYSLNVVGYYNVQCPPGLSLIANSLRFQPTNNVISELWPTAPDGLQVYKYGANETYEGSTFDGVSQTWSNPGFDVSTGTGFYVRNPTSQTIYQTFVGEVLQGVLVNPLPEGFTTKGSLVPMAGSINTVQLIPGDPGDELSIYTNDLQGGGAYSVSTFSALANAWVPDLVLNVGQGFWIRKQRAQDWTRIFYVY